ncbi:hypothetical protein BDV10DRAFT_203806 [Aspergillus recurvatus]
MGNNPPVAISNLSGKVAIVTGGHSGLGFGTSIELAKHGARVYIATRSARKFDEAKREILTELPDADVMCVPYEETVDGFEVQIAVNYIGHFLLTKLLLPTLQKTAESASKGSVRIVNVSSDGHAKLAPKEGIIFADINMKDDFSVWARYGHSKLANVLHSKELARRFPDILSVSLHPGTVKTNLSAGPVSSTPLYRLIKPLVEFGAPGPRKGAANILYAAVSPALKTEFNNGAYLLPVGRVTAPSKAGSNPKMAEELWVWTEKALASRGFD